MRRIIAAILVFGSLGLAATVCISWWVAIDVQRSTFLNAGDYPVIWQWPGALVQRNDSRPPDVRERGENLEYERMAAAFDVPYWSALDDVPEDSTRRVMEIATGWPLKTFRMVGEGEGSFTESVDMRFDGTMIGDLALSRFGTRTKPITRLPVQPIWLNLIVSVFVWAVLCGLILNVPRFIRVIRWNLRREKKKCGWCGHDPRMQRSEVCTECGNELDTPPRWLGGPSIVGAVLLLVALVCGEAMLLVQFLSHQPIQDIHWASARGDVDGVRVAIEGGADVDSLISYYDYPDRKHSAHGMTPLLLAIRNGDYGMIDELLGAGADPNLKGLAQVPVVAATERGDEHVVRRLLEAKANPLAVDRRTNVLAIAATSNDLEMVNLLLDSQTNTGVKIPMNLLDAALAQAARRSHIEIVETLLDHGAPITWNVLNAAVQGTWETVEVLVERGADLTAKADNGVPLLSQCSGTSDGRIWQAILDAGADIEARDPRGGKTALLNAVEAANAEFVAFLLQAGADPNARDDEGRAAQDLIARVRPFRWRVRSIDRIERLLVESLRPSEGNGAGPNSAGSGESGPPGG